MEVLDGSPASHISVTCGLHPVLAVQRGKYNLPRTRPRRPQCTISQRGRQSAEKPVYAAKDAFRRLLGMRHLHRKCPRLGNGLEKEPPRDPGADPHLPGLEHDVRLPPPPLILALDSV